MLNNTKNCLLALLIIVLFHPNAQAFTTYKLAPNETIVLKNTLNRPISSYCLINAVSNVVNSISIYMLSGAGMFNGNSITPGQTLFENIYNTQYIPISANAYASARITNIGGYTVQAQCTLS